MEINCVKGERIILKDVRSQTFIGTVKSVNPELGRVVLTDMEQIPGHKAISGYRNFDKNEILHIEKCKSYTTDDVPVMQSNEEKQFEKSVAKMSESEFNEIKRLQSEYRYIRDFGTNFYSAMALLKACSKIGVYGSDVSEGRLRRASVMAISAPSNIFVFDLQALGDAVLDKGLKDILESSKIVKVVYDCRMLSDCLKHKHLINLENIRDVEAEDIMIVFQDRRMIRTHPRSLEYLIKVYLGVEIEGCNKRGEVWDERPLPTNLQETVVSFVSFLIPLQEAMERKYLQRLICASNIYNSSLRNLDFFDFLHENPKKTLRKQMCKLVTPQHQTRTDCKSEKRKVVKQNS